MRVEETILQTLACQISSTLIQLLFLFDQDIRLRETFLQTLACRTSMQPLFSFDYDNRAEKTLTTLASQLSSILA